MLRSVMAMVLLCASGLAAAETAQRWVVGSYVNVRAQAAIDAEVVDHLIANTPVTLLNTSADFCEISWGNNQQGFIACKLLGEQPLNLAEIGTETLPDGQPNSKYSPLRAFWLEPTIKRFFEAGEHFRKVMLPAKQLLAENCFENYSASDCPSNDENLESSPKASELKRFKIPEFEAMKKLMADGLVAPRSQFIPLVTWQDLGADIQKQESSRFYQDIPPAIYEQIKLPAVKPSFFKSVDEIGRAKDGAEQLSAQYRIPYRMSVSGKPEWGGDSNSGPRLMGAWDIGKVRDSLTKPVYEVAINIKGETSVGETVARVFEMRREDPCDGLFAQGTAENLLPSYKKINQPWIFFRLAQPPVLTKASVNVKKVKNTTKMEIFLDATPRAKFTTAGIDLDNDGVVDLFVWDDGVDGIDYDDPEEGTRRRYIFVNVAGLWYLLDIDQEHACNC